MTLLIVLACGSNDYKPDDDGTTDTGPIGSDEDDTAETEDTATTTNPAGLSGTVTVIPLGVDEDGYAVELSWDEVNGGVYPFGKIWVDTFVIDERTGKPDYGATTVVSEPTTGANPWSLDIGRVRRGEVWVQAMVDYYTDGIIGTGEPSALWHEPLTLSPGDSVSDIDLYITAQWPFPTGGGGNETVVSVSGDAAVDREAGDPCLAMLFSADYTGPIFWGFFSNTTDDPLWSVATYANWGNMPLAGACDTNNNELIDPADAWGTYVVDGLNANPVDVGASSLSGLRLEIPYDGAFTTAEPIITLSGQVTDVNGFSSYPSGAILYVIAQHTLRNADFSTSDFVRDYDYEVFSGSELTGSAIDYVLTVPAYKDIYLWAWVDLDADGIVNEPGEPVGSGPGGMGKLYSSTSYEDLEIAVQSYAEPPT